VQLCPLQVVVGKAWEVIWQEIAVFLEKQVFDVID